MTNLAGVLLERGDADRAIIVYQTAFADVDGKLQFRPDIYNRDAEIWSRLHPMRQPLAEREPVAKRG